MIYVLVFLACLLIGTLNGFLLDRWTRRRLSLPPVVVQTRDGCVLSPCAVRAGMTVSATRYDHGARQVIVTVEQGPDVLAAVVAAVNGDIGGRVGLGFSTPGYGGSAARY